MAERNDTPGEMNGETREMNEETKTVRERDIIEVFSPLPTLLTKMNRIDMSETDDRRRRQKNENPRNDR